MDKIKLNPAHITDVKGLSINDTTVASSATEIDQFLLTENVVDISTSGSYWVVSPYAGTIEKIYTVIDGAITDGNSGLTFEIGGTAVTGGAITIAHSGSGAGTVDSSTPTALNIVTAGQAIEIVLDGGSTGTTRAVVTFVMQRT